MSSEKSFFSTFFPSLTPHKYAQLEAYADLLLDVNEGLNLISRKDTDHIRDRHILHSLSIAKVNAFLPEQRVLDIGTGGGLPGIPLAILFPETEFYLVDSIGKKVAAVKTMAEELGLDNVYTAHQRVEKLNMTFDFAVSRAVTALPKINRWLKGKVHKGHESDLPNGLIYIKGGDFQEELNEINKPYRLWSISDWFNDPFFETKKVVWIKV